MENKIKIVEGTTLFQPTKAMKRILKKMAAAYMAVFSQTRFALEIIPKNPKQVLGLQNLSPIEIDSIKLHSRESVLRRLPFLRLFGTASDRFAVDPLRSSVFVLYHCDWFKKIYRYLRKIAMSDDALFVFIEGPDGSVLGAIILYLEAVHTVLKTDFLNPIATFSSLEFKENNVSEDEFIDKINEMASKLGFGLVDRNSMVGSINTLFLDPHIRGNSQSWMLQMASAFLISACRNQKFLNHPWLFEAGEAIANMAGVIDTQILTEAYFSNTPIKLGMTSFDRILTTCILGNKLRK